MAEAPPASLETGLALAEQRRVTLKSLIRSNPEAALLQAIPWRLRVRLPEEIVAQLEERVSATAKFSVLAAVPAPGRDYDGPAIRRTARIGDAFYEAHVYGTRAGVNSKDQLPVEGIAVDDQLAILDSPLRRLEADEPLPGDPVPVVSPEHDGGSAATASQIWVSGGRAYEL